MSIKSKAELIMAIEDYECGDRQKLAEGIDITASQNNSDDRILVRVITEPKSKSGFVGIDAVKKMEETLKGENYDRGILISDRFTAAARQEMRRKDIRMISEKFMPSFEPQRLYLKVQDYVDNLCRAKCGKVPKKESDCKGCSESSYTCEVRLISDDALFHREHMWKKLLQHDIKRLLALNAHFEQDVI
jgi:hypothetical protein